jgi:predicted acylesterase/phospholipase RssA
MDGGILNNFPVDIIRTVTTDPVIAFDATWESRVLEGSRKPIS